MRVGGTHYRTIWLDDDGWSVRIIDQTALPSRFEVRRLTSLDQVAVAIRSMQVRGAPLIGVAAAYGICLALRNDPTNGAVEAAAQTLLATRPTAVNLRWALERMRAALLQVPLSVRVDAAYREAAAMAEEDVAVCAQIGEHGERLLRERWAELGQRGRLEVLTHCNAGWLATVDWGTALAPVYRAHDAGLPVHVWVGETRPRNQGLLTTWELAQHGVPHTLIVDNAGGLLMQRGRVHLSLVGADRVTQNGDVCNKIGTYLKALAARDTGTPFYVGAPSSSVDWSTTDPALIPIEERDPSEVQPDSAIPTANPAFDVTPGRLVTALITERGVCPSTSAGLASLFPERAVAPLPP